MLKPKGWKYEKLGKLCEWGSGGTPLKSHSEYYGGDIKWAIIGDLNEETIYDTKNKITIQGLENSSAKLIPRDTLLIGMYGSIGKTAITGCELSTNQAIAFAIPKKELLNLYFLKYFINFNISELFKKSKGGTQKNISQEILKKFKIPYPKITEQKLIVNEIEKQFTRLDSTVKTLQNVKERLEVYRKSVLHRAFSGTLSLIFREKNIEEWKNDLDFEENSSGKIDFPLPTEWAWARLDSICNKVQDGSHFSPKTQYSSRQENTFPYITAKNIKPRGIDLTNITYVDRDFFDSIYQRCNTEKGDILLTKDGVKTGTVVISSLEEPFALLSSVALIKCKKNLLKPEFLKYYIESPIGFKMIIGKMTGTAIKRIILERIRTTFVPLTSIKEQEFIVQEIDSRFSVIDKLEETVDNALSKAEQLKKSILKVAFEGKLVNYYGVSM